VENEGPLVFACTLQCGRVTRKIKKDISAIVAGGSVAGIYVFLEADLPVSRRHDLIGWAMAERRVDVTILDGNALAQQLAQPDLYWIPERYLALPSRSALRQLAADHPIAPLACGVWERGRLPRKVRPLIGRDAEVTLASAWLVSGDTEVGEVGRPAVVVTGPPGAGKTILALEVARNVAGQFPDGQFYVDVPPPQPAGDDADLVSLLVHPEVLAGTRRNRDSRCAAGMPSSSRHGLWLVTTPLARRWPAMTRSSRIKITSVMVAVTS
jgi:hypothetical protein